MNITQQRVGQICIQEGFIDDEKLAQIIAIQHAYEYVTLDDKIDQNLLNMVPLELMTKYQFIPYEMRDDTFVIAMAEPRNFLKAVDELEILLDMNISIVVANEKKIKELLKKIESSSSMVAISEDMRLPLVRETEKGENILSIEKVSMEESPIVRLIDSTILDAINKRASDIHIETSEEGVIIRYRIDGMLHPGNRATGSEIPGPDRLENQGNVRTGHFREKNTPGRAVQTKGQ
ncbi:MAG: hypothetical protein JRI39_11635 [Deltaproteobacteria bacterium]|nr:hypothetical protein [Deltaproteobacteria bacterium]